MMERLYNYIVQKYIIIEFQLIECIPLKALSGNVVIRLDTDNGVLQITEVPFV